ncbi:hypothetical protein CY34DRAFT_82626 [Suillus luteus UH-Slu-Lm8-n1]|uniref:Uncharacterized protein n=1 Tax=Suillus luteus UH-Slu-Lm8-n1 TaxID=930992 RepID=A0A0D0BIH6_9AGAM|nr:hypothetical protein CY34DRAFT_82626 [Suillus luteus UH-Slu-Lm8-n1]
MLQTIWVATNATLKTQWQHQLDEDALAAGERQRLLDDTNAQRLAAHALQEAAVAEEDRKKNWLHHIIIPDRPRPKCAAEAVLVSDFALCKLNNVQFVELIYWTNKGLADAKLKFLATDDDSMVPTTALDGSTSWIAASVAHPAAGVIADHLLSPLDFSHVIPRFITSLEHRGWDNSRVIMLANFFGALMFHDYWTSDNELEQRALLMYAEGQRRAWHAAIPLPSGAWNLAILDGDEIYKIYDPLYHADRDRKDHEFDLKVRLFSHFASLSVFCVLRLVFFALCAGLPRCVYCVMPSAFCLPDDVSIAHMPRLFSAFPNFTA